MHHKSFGVFGAGVLLIAITSCVTPAPETKETTTVTVTPTPTASQTPTTSQTVAAETSASATQSAEERTVLIQGKRYTCSQIIDSKSGACDGNMQKAFNKWAPNIDNYVNSGRLGPWGNGDSPPLSYERVAMLGLLACEMNAQGLTVEHFLKVVAIVPELSSMEPITPEKEEIRAFWRAAQTVMCPA
jgi:hypothetical protein